MTGLWDPVRGYAYRDACLCSDVVFSDRCSPGYLGEHVLVLQHHVSEVLFLAGAEVLSHRDLRYALPGDEDHGGRHRWGCPGLPLLQEVHMIQLGGLAPPRLPHPVVHLPHAVDHLIRSLPLGQELAIGSRDENQDPLPRLEETQLGPAVVGPRLGLLCLVQMLPYYGPDLRHSLSYLLDMVH